MELLDQFYFDLLKSFLRKKVSDSLQIRKALKDWSLNDIKDFQDDLERECKSTVSEKWIYTHLKKKNEKLPRVDVLNLLSCYCGYKNWDDFKYQQKQEGDSIDEQNKKPSRLNLKLVLFTLVILSLTAIWYFSNKQGINLVFEDAYTHERISCEDLTMKFYRINPVEKIAEATVLWKPGTKTDTLWVDGAYYKPNKIVLFPKTSKDTLVVELLPDDYALMLNYFSRSSMENWKKRRQLLDEVIHRDARLFQVHPDLNGLEMLNKEEFIERLTLPINSLKNLNILHIEYRDEQIYRLRFVQNIEENEKD